MLILKEFPLPKKLYCWEALKCGKTECPAYGLNEHKCWLIPGTLCNDNISGGYIPKIIECLECRVLKTNITASSLNKTLWVLSHHLKDTKLDIERRGCKNKQDTDGQRKFYVAILQDIIEFMPDPTFAIDNDKNVIAWNKAIEKMTGVKKLDIIGKGDYAYAVPFYGYKRPILIDLLNSSDEALEKTYSNFIRESDSISGEVVIPDPITGKERHIWATASPIYTRDGGKIGAIESIRDITELKDHEKMNVEVNNQLRRWANDLEKTTMDLSTLISLMKLIQGCTNIEEAYDIISRSMVELFPAFSGCIYIHNIKTNELEMRSSWGGFLIGENAFKLSHCWALKSNRIHISQTKKKKGRCKILSSDFSGGYICIPLTAHGNVIGLLHLQAARELLSSLETEITDSRKQFLMLLGENLSLSIYSIQLRETLRYQAIRDPLTGLFNRRYMEESLKRELHRAHRRKSTVGLILFDIDHFKKFNDTFGHEAGDTTLREIASFVSANIRAEDIVSRYGGEEFLITMPDASREITRQRAEKLRQEVKKLEIMNRGERLGTVTMSFGVAVYPAHADNWESLIKAADDALYKAKRDGRDRVVIASNS